MARPVAHAQHGEDIRLLRVFGDRPSGFYVDVGAAHPVFHSVTHLLYDLGWRGVNIEPLPAFFSLLDEHRPHDVNLRAALGRSDGERAQLHEVVELPGSSTIHGESASNLRAAGHAIVEHDVAVMTLRSVCERHAPGCIDVLKIDVEGAEAEVLAGADWVAHRPRVLLVEANHTDLWEPMLLEHGYLKATFDGVNHWYVEQADAGWIETLAAPLRLGEHYVPFGAARPPRSGAPGPRMLVVLSSENQLYSGTGRVLFETLARITADFTIEVAIDDRDGRNLALAVAFCATHDLPLHVGAGTTTELSPDSLNTELGDLLQRTAWDIVLAVSWANAATNAAVLEHLGDAALAYLPLHQPSWTIPLGPQARISVDATHRAMLRRADVVFCLTPWERAELHRFAAPTLPACAVTTAGCDFRAFRPGPPARGLNVLFVGDHREPRKRFDRVIKVLGAVRALGVPARLVVIGNESERAVRSVPADLAGAVVALGYVSEEQLRAAYQDAAVLLLLSEYEAYGLPMIEALASATPVVMTDQPAPASLLKDEAAVHFVDPDDVDTVARLVADLLSDGVAARERLAQRHEALATRFDWDVGRHRTRDHLLAAWVRRARAVHGFIPVAGR